MQNVSNFSLVSVGELDLFTASHQIEVVVVTEGRADLQALQAKA